MLINKETVLHMIEDNFLDDVEHGVMIRIMEMDGYNLYECFENPVDYGDLEGMDDLEVEEFSVEKEGECDEVSGTLVLRATLGGYVHWDGEDEYVESCEVQMKFLFCFKISDGKCGAFAMDEFW